MRAVRSALALAAIAAATATTPSARAAPDRVAVLILPEPGTDPSLADNLNEIAIAHIADRWQLELAGTLEFRRTLGVESDERALRCLAEPACLERVGAAMGVRRLVTGTVGVQHGGGYLVQMTLRDIQSGRAGKPFSRSVQGGLEEVIRTTRDGTEELFRLPEHPGRIRVESDAGPARVMIDGKFVGNTPALVERLLPGRHSVSVERENHLRWTRVVEVNPATDLRLNLTIKDLPRRRRWPSYVGFGGLGVAATAVAAATIFGELAQHEPSTGTRRELQTDLARRQGFATTANVLFIASAVIAAASLGVLVGYRRDVMGGQ